jgi:hypothetical protein
VDRIRTASHPKAFRLEDIRNKSRVDPIESLPLLPSWHRILSLQDRIRARLRNRATNVVVKYTEVVDQEASLASAANA